MSTSPDESVLDCKKASASDMTTSRTQAQSQAISMDTSNLQANPTTPASRSALVGSAPLRNSPVKSQSTCHDLDTSHRMLTDNFPGDNHMAGDHHTLSRLACNSSEQLPDQCSVQAGDSLSVPASHSWNTQQTNIPTNACKPGSPQPHAEQRQPSNHEHLQSTDHSHAQEEEQQQQQQPSQLCVSQRRSRQKRLPKHLQDAVTDLENLPAAAFQRAQASAKTGVKRSSTPEPAPPQNSDANKKDVNKKDITITSASVSEQGTKQKAANKIVPKPHSSGSSGSIKQQVKGVKKETAKAHSGPHTVPKVKARKVRESFADEPAIADMVFTFMQPLAAPTVNAAQKPETADEAARSIQEPACAPSGPVTIPTDLTTTKEDTLHVPHTQAEALFGQDWHQKEQPHFLEGHIAQLPASNDPLRFNENDWMLRHEHQQTHPGLAGQTDSKAEAFLTPYCNTQPDTRDWTEPPAACMYDIPSTVSGDSIHPAAKQPVLFCRETSTEEAGPEVMVSKRVCPTLRTTPSLHNQQQQKLHDQAQGCASIQPVIMERLQQQEHIHEIKVARADVEHGKQELSAAAGFGQEHQLPTRLPAPGPTHAFKPQQQGGHSDNAHWDRQRSCSISLDIEAQLHVPGTTNHCGHEKTGLHVDDHFQSANTAAILSGDETAQAANGSSDDVFHSFQDKRIGDTVVACSSGPAIAETAEVQTDLNQPLASRREKRQRSKKVFSDYITDYGSKPVKQQRKQSQVDVSPMDSDAYPTDLQAFLLDETLKALAATAMETFNDVDTNQGWGELPDFGGNCVQAYSGGQQHIDIPGMCQVQTAPYSECSAHDMQPVSTVVSINNTSRQG